MLFELHRQHIPFVFSYTVNGEMPLYMEGVFYNKARDLFPEYFRVAKLTGAKTTYFKIKKPAKLDSAGFDELLD
jgi:hypothetical protein